MHVKRIPDGTCFRKVIFPHPGPTSILHLHDSPFCPTQVRGFTSEFVQYAVEAFGLSSVKVVNNTVTLIGRRPYIAHPRIRTSRATAERHIANEVYYT